MQTPRVMNRKEAFIRKHAASRQLRLVQILAKCECAPSVFYRVVRNTAKSARVDGIIARELGVKEETIRRLTNAD